jgi:hypothetical protein
MEKDGESFKMFQSLCYVRCRCRIDSVNASASVMSNAILKSEVGLSVWKTTEVQAHKTLETKRLRQAASISQHNSNLDRARSNNTGWAWGSLGQVELQGRSRKARMGECMPLLLSCCSDYPRVKLKCWQETTHCVPQQPLRSLSR